MPSDKPSTHKSFTTFRSAAEEAAMKLDQAKRDNEGGHLSATGGRVTHVPGAELPYIVVLSHDLSQSTEHAFATMGEAEAFIKRNTPVPAATLSSTYDRPADGS